jgi:hypothetical protein
MDTQVQERSDEAQAGDKSQTPVWGFLARFAITHTAVYFVSGMIFAALMNYEALFASAEYAFMRPFDHPLVILGPTLQLFRGALLACAFLPFRKVIVESKRGWVYLFVATLILMHIGADAADPGKIEGFIYADFGLVTHVATWPESIFSSLAFAWLFHTWERRPNDKRLIIPLIVVVIVTVAAAILGLLFMGAA